MLTTTALKTLLHDNHLRLSKKLGQNYLIDPTATQRIVDAAHVSKTDYVVEVGAGLGALTEPLAQQAGVVLAVEVDRGICPLLVQQLKAQAHVTVECKDALTLNPRKLQDAVVVGAIPYSITSPLLVWLYENRRLIRRAILVLQQEVAQRIMAKPGTAAYGRLSVLLQYGWEVEKVGAIARSAFFPQPQVDSICLRLIPYKTPPVSVQDEALFFSVVKAAFSQRRKTLANCLRELPGSRQALSRLGWPTNVRGETLSLAQFASLATALAETV